MFVFMFSVIVLLLFNTFLCFLYTGYKGYKWQTNDKCTNMYFVNYLNRSSQIYTTLYINFDYQCIYFMQLTVVVCCNFAL